MAARRRSSASRGGAVASALPELSVAELTRWDGFTFLVSSFYLLLYLSLYWLVGSSFWALVLPLIAWGAWEWRALRPKGDGASPLNSEAGEGDAQSRQEKEEEDAELHRREAINREKQLLAQLMAGVLQPSRRPPPPDPVPYAPADDEEKKADGRPALGGGMTLEVTTPLAHTHVLLGKKPLRASQSMAGLDTQRPRSGDSVERKAYGAEMPVP